MSLAAHVALVLVLVAALGPGHREAAHETLARLVYVEPAPPPAPALEAGASPASDVPPASATEREPEESDTPRPITRLVTRPRRAAPPVHGRPAPAPPIPAAAVPASGGDGVAGGHGDTVGGTADGVAGGTVGGLGDTPLALRDVAGPPELIERIVPDYPPRARAMELEGQVVLEVVLDRGGKVEDSIRVTRSIPLLDAAAVAAVRQWRFRPARDHAGHPVRVIMEIPVRFVLR